MRKLFLLVTLLLVTAIIQASAGVGWEKKYTSAHRGMAVPFGAKHQLHTRRNTVHSRSLKILYKAIAGKSNQEPANDQPFFFLNYALEC